MDIARAEKFIPAWRWFLIYDRYDDDTKGRVKTAPHKHIGRNSLDIGTAPATRSILQLVSSARRGCCCCDSHFEATRTGSREADTKVSARSYVSRGISEV